MHDLSTVHSRNLRLCAAALVVLLTAVSLAGCFGTATPTVDVKVNLASWGFDNPVTGLHSARGEYFLTLNVTLRIAGEGDGILSPGQFMIFWQGVQTGQLLPLSPWTSLTIHPAMDAMVTLGTNASTLYLPDRLELHMIDRPAVSAPIPAPAAAPSELQITVKGSTLADAGLQGVPPARGNTYLWVTAGVRNQWKDQAKLSNTNFWVGRADGAAIGANGFLGPTTVPPQREVEVRLSFEVPAGWNATELGYDMALGPWTNAPFPVIAGTLTYYSAALEVPSTAWTYESAAGAHGQAGDLFLHTNIVLTNTGLGPLTSPEYTLTWQGGAQTTVVDSRVPAPGASMAYEVVFPATTGMAPSRLEAWLVPSVHLSVIVPTPAPPPVEVELLAIQSVWADANLAGAPPAPGKTFVWVNTTLHNAWSGHLAVGAGNFWLVLPDMSAAACAGFLGPATVPPGLTASVRLAFEVPPGWSGAKLSYEMGAGPWTQVPLSAPQALVEYYGASLVVQRAEWNYDSAGGHTLPGEYTLALDANLTNTALGNIAGAPFALLWSDGNLSNATAAASVAPGQSMLLRLSFPSTGLRTPQALSAAVAPGKVVWAPVPAPLAPPVEVELKGLTGAWADAGLDGTPAAVGSVFLWLNATVVNHWARDVSAALLSFALEGPNGFKVYAANRTGPDAVGPGGFANVTLGFEVPAGFSPARLHYAMAAGPWTSVDVPAPNRTVVYRSASVAFSWAAWSYESPAGAYVPRGSQYYYVNAEVTNSGVSNLTISPADFSAVWNATGFARPGEALWGPLLLGPGANASMPVGFLVSPVAAPDSVRLTIDAARFSFAWKTAPAGSPAQPYVQLASVNATWSNTSLAGVNATGSSRYLWITFDLVDLWRSSIALSPASFIVEGTGSTTYGSPEFRGPSSVGAGGRASVTLVFQVPFTWSPWWLHFDAPSGPWADAALATPA